MKERFQYAADIQQIPSIRKDLSMLADRWQIPGSVFNQVRFIIEELFSNIVRYGYQDTGSHMVEVLVKLDSGTILIELSDDGVPFDPLHYRNIPPSDPAAPGSGGMGLALVRTFADSISYRRAGHKNQLEITKKMKSNRN